jgi:putative endonuclease
MKKQPVVYILTNRKKGVLYIGVTSDIVVRMALHISGKGSKFAAKYGLTTLVHIEYFETMLQAIEREKDMKKWKRAWKVELINLNNPEWRDLKYDL